MAELDDLKRKLRARERTPGYRENAEEIRKRIEQLERGGAKED
jgi:hypothetical protein